MINILKYLWSDTFKGKNLYLR